MLIFLLLPLPTFLKEIFGQLSISQSSLLAVAIFLNISSFTSRKNLYIFIIGCFLIKSIVQRIPYNSELPVQIIVYASKVEHIFISTLSETAVCLSGVANINICLFGGLLIFIARLVKNLIVFMIHNHCIITDMQLKIEYFTIFVIIPYFIPNINNF